MLFLGIIQFLVIAYITLIEFKHKSPVVFLWATLLIMFGVMHAFNCITGDYEYSNTVLNKASIFVITFCLFYYFIRYIFFRSRSSTTRTIFQASNVKTSIQNEYSSDGLLFWIFVGAMALKLVPYLRFVGSIFSSSWSSGRDYSASLGYVNTEQLARIFIYALSGLIALFILKKDKRWILIAGLVLFGVLLTRNRIEILPLFCSLIALFIFKTDKLKMRDILVASLAAVVVIYLVYALRVLRHYGTIQDFITNFNLSDFNSKILLYLATDNGELGLRRNFCFFIKGNNKFADFGKMHSYIRMLFVYFPTSWTFGLKPNDFAIAMGQAIGMKAGGSTHPTLFGDCYANLGALGVMLGAFWAIYASILDIIIAKQPKMYIRVLMYVLCGVAYVIIGRGSVYNGFWFVAYGIPLLIVLQWLFTHVKIQRFVIRKRMQN